MLHTNKCIVRIVPRILPYILHYLTIYKEMNDKIKMSLQIGRIHKCLNKDAFFEKFQQVRLIKYIQGQEPEPKIREYFYYIDHQGMLFLDDSKMKNFTSCFKEKKFLEFFFKRIRLNKTGRFEKEFPFISLCGRERNYIRCDDLPIVYTHVVDKQPPEKDILTFGYAGDLLKTEFVPEKLFMSPTTGRVYHPADEKYGGIGLVRSKLSIELSKYFSFSKEEMQSPTHFTWKGETYKLDHGWFYSAINKHNVKIRSDPD